VRPAPQLTLGGRYTLAERIAVGGVGEVWRTSDDVLGRDVAVKVLREEYAADPNFLERFRNEARHTAALSHPGIANVFDYGEVDGTAYLVMELVPGEPLSAVVGREERLSAKRTLHIVGQVALALHAAHLAGVIHRDVKPGNLLVGADDVVNVTDFGIARAVGAETVTDTGLVVGTAAYLSPEQATGKEVTPSSDVYSLGVVAYECLAGRRPFVADTAMGVAMAHATSEPPDLPGDVPPLVADFVMRALDKDPARRQPDAQDFGRTALALAAQLDAPEPTPSPTPTPTPTAVMPAVDPVVEPAGSPTTSTGASERLHPGRGTFIAAGAALVVLGFLLLYACTGGSDGTKRPTRQPTTQATSAGPTTVRVRAADYLGRSVDDATRDLRRAGLQVATNPEPSDLAPGTVTAIAPTGTVREGTTVTVTVAVEQPHPDKGPKKKHGKGHDD
jgi:eukaryotic-like serine/threonine-protein kinase